MEELKARLSKAFVNTDIVIEGDKPFSILEEEGFVYKSAFAIQKGNISHKSLRIMRYHNKLRQHCTMNSYRLCLLIVHQDEMSLSSGSMLQKSLRKKSGGTFFIKRCMYQTPALTISISFAASLSSFFAVSCAFIEIPELA